MGQDEVLKWLQAHPGWHTRREMGQCLGRRPDFFQYALTTLVKSGEVESGPIDGRAMEYRINA